MDIKEGHELYELESGSCSMIYLTIRATCEVFQYRSNVIVTDPADPDGEAVDQVLCMLRVDDRHDLMTRLAELFEVDMCHWCCAIENGSPWYNEDR